MGWGDVSSELGRKVEGAEDHSWGRGNNVHLGSRMDGRRLGTLRMLKRLVGPECS